MTTAANAPRAEHAATAPQAPYAGRAIADAGLAPVRVEVVK
ncbi:unnamed protein product [Burkholderia pseudomallei]|nr:unnamed protein product [Burkholderia pseudomallei]